MKQGHPNDWSGKSRGGVAGYLVFVFLIRKLGLGAAYALLAFVALYFIPFSPSSTASVWLYSRKILGKSRISSVFFLYKNYYNLGVALIDKTAASAGLYDKFTFVFDEPDDVKEILAGESGALIVGAHFGNWEVGAPYFGKYGKKMNVVMMDVEYRNIKSILERQNKLSAFSVIPVADDSLDHVFMIRDAIARGEYVAMQGDRLTPNGKSAQAVFLGEPALFPLGPFVLASRTEAPVIFYYAIREGFKKYKFVFRLFKPDEFSRRRGGELIILNSYVNELESVVKSAPEQWYNFYKFWL
jgi:predicted LPLAT superfamily acyltransferase